MLIKLTNIPHPDVNDGKPEPVYVDTRAIIMIGRGRTGYVKEGSLERNRQAMSAYIDFMNAFAEKYRSYQSPDLHDPASASWVMSINKLMNTLQSLQGDVIRLANEPAYHPRVDCTSITLLVRDASWHAQTIHVTETPEEVAELVHQDAIRLNPRAY